MSSPYSPKKEYIKVTNLTKGVFGNSRNKLLIFLRAYLHIRAFDKPQLYFPFLELTYILEILPLKK